MSLIPILLLSILLWSCQEQNTNPNSNNNSAEPKINTEKSHSFFDREQERLEKRRSYVFQPLLDSAGSSDTMFLQHLIRAYELEEWQEAIVHYSGSSPLYGLEDSIWLIDLKLPNDSLCAPFGKHYQLIFNAKGQLIHEDSAAQAELLELWEDQPPLLMTFNHDCNHLGQHHFYKYEKGVLIDIFNVLMESTPPTFDQDATADGIIYQPSMMDLRIEDQNKDGWNDLVFRAQKLILRGPDSSKTYTLWRPYRREAMEYVFLFQKNEDWFVQKQ